jgi:hypothetical protein
MATTPLLQRGNGGSTPSGTTDWNSFMKRAGPRVRWRHASVVGRWTEFDSRADLGLMNRGLLVQRDDAWPATRRSGFDSPAVHLHAFSQRLLWKVAGYGWPGRTANAVSPRGMRVRIPCLPLHRPDGEEDNHTSVLTRSPGFESWSGHRGASGPGGEMDDHASLLTRCSGFESWPGH